MDETQENFGQANLGEAQAENPPLDPDHLEGEKEKRWAEDQEYSSKVNGPEDESQSEPTQ